MTHPSETGVPADTTLELEEHSDERDDRQNKRKRKTKRSLTKDSLSTGSLSTANTQGHGRRKNRFRKFYASGTPTKERQSTEKETAKEIDASGKEGETQPFLGRDQHGNDFVYSADDEPNVRRLPDEEEDDESIVAEIVETTEVDNVVVANTGKHGTDLELNNRSHSRTRPEKGNTSIMQPNEAPAPKRYISRNEFVPDGKLTEEYVRDLLGGRHRRIAPDVVIENMRRIEELKMDLSRHFKTEVERKMVSIAVKCPLVKQSTFEGLQKLWLSLNPKTTTNYSAYEDSYWRITQKRSSDLWPANWDKMQEALYMKRNRIRYKKEGKEVDKTKGCIARMCGLAIRKARRRIWYYGEKEHGRKISAVRPPLPEGKRGKNDRLKRKDWNFHPEYVRCVKGENIQLSDSNAEVDSDDGDTPSPSTTNNRKARQAEPTKRVARVRNFDCDDLVDECI